ncbi:MAG: DUF2405 domain-containing protein [Candidatus Gastranaerophilales bacterium]|nr:DUF2405 domain-containing protein [Candidatus Gastranaerophilales bacterium]
MGLSSNQARLNFLTLRKDDLEARLMMISAQSQDLATKQAELISRKSAALQQFTNEMTSKETDEKVSFETTAIYIDIENEMALLEIADNNLTQQKNLAETEHQAVNAEKEEIQKLVDNNIKTSFKIFN